MCPAYERFGAGNAVERDVELGLEKDLDFIAVERFVEFAHHRKALVGNIDMRLVGPQPGNALGQRMACRRGCRPDSVRGRFPGVARDAHCHRDIDAATANLDRIVHDTAQSVERIVQLGRAEECAIPGKDPVFEAVDGAVACRQPEPVGNALNHLGGAFAAKARRDVVETRDDRSDDLNLGSVAQRLLERQTIGKAGRWIDPRPDVVVGEPQPDQCENHGAGKGGKRRQQRHGRMQELLAQPYGKHQRRGTAAAVERYALVRSRTKRAEGKSERNAQSKHRRKLARNAAAERLGGKRLNDDARDDAVTGYRIAIAKFDRGRADQDVLATQVGGFRATGDVDEAVPGDRGRLDGIVDREFVEGDPVGSCQQRR